MDIKSIYINNINTVKLYMQSKSCARITLPIEIVRAFGWGNGDKLIIKANAIDETFTISSLKKGNE